MKNLSSRLATGYTLIFLISCSHDHPHEHHESQTQEGEEITASLTVWTEYFELFAEYRPFVVGEPTSLASHFTDLKGYTPVSKGKLTVGLTGEGQNLVETVDTLLQPGIFVLTITPQSAGPCQLSFKMEASGLQEVIMSEEVTVYKSREEAASKLIPPAEGDITFLKEQAWNTGFGVAKAKVRSMEERIAVTGQLVNPPAFETTLAANAVGILVFSREMFPGLLLRKNESLGVISGKDILGGVAAEENIQLEFLNARSRLAQARANYERHVLLYADSVISTSDFEQQKMAYELAETEFQTLKNNYVEPGGIAVKSGTTGYINEIWAQTGDYLQVGEPIFSIHISGNELLLANVPVKLYNKIPLIKSINWRDEGEWIESEVQITSFPKQIEPGDVFVPVWMKAPNLNGITGRFIEVELVFSRAEKKLVIPTGALLEDYGVYSVIVQITGESFEKREVKIGQRDSQNVEVVEGLREDEIVVIRGAYQVKMAGISGEAPAHGHEH